MGIRLGWYGNQVEVTWNGMEIGWSQYGNQVEVEWRLNKSRMKWNKSKKSDNSWVGGSGWGGMV